jgi:hypothetical protein
MVAVLYAGGQGFGALFGVLTALAAVIAVSAAFLPMARRAAATATAEAGD